MFGLLSTIPMYNDIVKPFVALSPVAFVGNIKSPVKYFAYVSSSYACLLVLCINCEF